MTLSNDKSTKINTIINSLLPITHISNIYDEKDTLVNRMKFYSTPGVSVAVVQDYKVDILRGFGLRSYIIKDPMTTDTVFNVHEASEAVFAAAVMRLYEQGKLDIDEDVNNYLKYWKIPPNESWQPRITLRKILSHTVGLILEKDFTLESIFKSNEQAPIRVNLIPDIQFHYNEMELGTTLAQHIVAEICGKSLDSIMKETILEPLGMTHSSFKPPATLKERDKAAIGHGKGYVEMSDKRSAAKELWSTPQDMALFGIELQRAVKGESDILSQSSLEIMLKANSNKPLAGMGIFLEGEDENLRFNQYGRTSGYVTRFVMYKNYGMGSVIMINADAGADIIMEIERAIAKAYNWPGYFDEQSKIELSTQELSYYRGDYETRSGVKFKVDISTGYLILEFHNQNPIEIFPQSKDNFFSKVTNTKFTFEWSDNQVIGLTIKEKDIVRAFKK